MKRIAMKFVFLWLAFFGGIRCGAEGFAAGTLVRIPDGYKRIEYLCIGDCVLCCDKKKNLVERPVVFIAKRAVEGYVSICVGDEYLRAACDQRFYSEKDDIWIAASALKKCDTLGQHDIAAINLVEKEVDAYLIGVAEHHNFFVTTADICAHNFFPPLVLAITAAFGSGTIEIAGVSFGLAGLGTFLGYKWHKKSKQKHDFGISSMTFDVVQGSDNVYNTEDAQAPGMPTEKDGFYPPKKWDGRKVKNPNGPGYGWPDKKGSVWVPTGPNGHGCPHWDVEYPDGSYDNVVPGGRIRGKK